MQLKVKNPYRAMPVSLRSIKGHVKYNGGGEEGKNMIFSKLSDSDSV